MSNTSIEDKAEAGIKTSTINDDSAVFSFNCTLSVKSSWTVRFVMFFNVSSAHQACIYLIQSTAKTVTFWIFLLFNNLFEYMLRCHLFMWFQIWVMWFQSQSHDPSEIILIFLFVAQKQSCIIIIIIMLKTAE